MVRIATTRYGFVALIFGREVSYAHFEPHIGIGWTRALTIGKRRWWFREDWTVFASSPPFRVYKSRQTSNRLQD